MKVSKQCTNLNCLVHHENEICNCNMDRYCEKCNQPEPKQEDWEKKFKKFMEDKRIHNLNAPCFFDALVEFNLKLLIQKLLSSQKQKIIEELKEEISLYLKVTPKILEKDILSLFNNKLKP